MVRSDDHSAPDSNQSSFWILYLREPKSSDEECRRKPRGNKTSLFFSLGFFSFQKGPRSNRELKTRKKMATHFWKPPKLKNGGPFLTNKNHFKNAIFVFVFDQLVPKGRSKLSYWVWNSKIFWNLWMQWCDQGCRKLRQSRASCHQQLEATSQQR